jgi:hypothetical protein
LLTDADLKVMVQWARDRFALSRYRDGWGVVCGLEVTCRQPSTSAGAAMVAGHGSAVYVSPGYAIDCCGNDLVVCEPIRVELDELCRSSDDPCDDPCDERVRPSEVRGGVRGEGKIRGVDPRPIDFGGMKVPISEILIVDLSLRYQEELSEGHRALFRAGCKDIGSCEYSRVLERPTVVPEILDFEDVLAERTAQDYEEKFKKDLLEAKGRIVELLKGQQDAVLHRLGTYTIYSVCFLIDYIRAQKPDTEAVWRPTVGMWLLLDWLQHQLLCPCQPCRSDRGVPLARLMLWRKMGRADCCRVFWIMSQPPNRRPLRLDCRPVPLNAVDIGRVIGMTLDQAKVELAREPIDLEDETEAKGLDSIVVKLSAEHGTRIRPQIVRDPLGVAHVVGLEQVNNPKP